MKAIKNITKESLLRAAKKSRNNCKPPADAKPEYIYLQAFVEGAEHMRQKAIEEHSFLRRKIDELKSNILHLKRENLKLGNIIKKLAKKLNN